MVPNAKLRARIAEMVHRSGEGHIPSSFSIVDVVAHLYRSVLKYDATNPNWSDRDFFILSKGHGCAALYVVLNEIGILSDTEIAQYGTSQGILGGHPDMTTVPGAEASTGSLGHGFPFSVGIALGLKIQGRANRVFTLLGDGECHEGTIWEAAAVAANRQLTNLVAIVDWNGSASQLMPVDDLPQKWSAFGWRVIEANGHDQEELSAAFGATSLDSDAQQPLAIILHTTKGKGVSFVEGHGVWHHKIPNESELDQMLAEILE